MVFFVTFQFLVPASESTFHLARRVGELPNEDIKAAFLVDLGDGFLQEFFPIRHGRGTRIVADAGDIHLVSIFFHEIEKLSAALGGENHGSDMSGKLDI